MKYFTSFLLALVLVQCKVETPTDNQSLTDKADTQPVSARKVDPDECVLTVDWVSSEDGGSTAVVKKIHERGFGFKQNLLVGDTIYLQNISSFEQNKNQKILVEHSMTDDRSYRAKLISDN